MRLSLGHWDFRRVWISELNSTECVPTRRKQVYSWIIIHAKARLHHLVHSARTKMNSLTKILSCKWAYLRLLSCSFSNCYMINAQLDSEITLEAIDKKKAEVGLDISLRWLMPSERRRIAHANISLHTGKPQEAKCPIWAACGHLINCFSGWKNGNEN